MSPTYRTQLDALASYRPGAPAPQRDGPAFKLSSNENPYPPLPSVRAVLQEALADINRYPSFSADAVVAAVAAHCGVKPEEIVLGAGSVEVVSALIRTVAGAGDEVVYAWRSFEAYPQLVVTAGATPVTVPLTPDLGHDLFGLAGAITPATTCVLICTPNNPTGTVVTAAELDDFMARVPPTVTVVIDEAYIEFDRDPRSPHGLDFFARYPNIVVCHTFSKAYGLAGLRIGYAVAPAELAEQMRKVSLSFGVSDLAQRAALASLDARDELAERVAVIVERRGAVEAALAAQGWRLPNSQANFVWLPTERTVQAGAILENHGLAGRIFAGEGARLSIGEAESLEPLIAAAGEILALS